MRELILREARPAGFDGERAQRAHRGIRVADAVGDPPVARLV
jgi:hypothetical protein